MLRIAHRGYSAHAPENTLAAFREALALGVDAIECDVHLTADGVPVVIHDAAVDRTTDGRGAVRDLTLAELRTFDAGGKTGPAYAGERIPTLAEVLDALRGTVTLCIELKAAGTAEATVEMLRAREMLAQAIIFSFHAEYLREAAALAPASRRLLLGNWAPVEDAGAFQAWLALVAELGAGYLGINAGVLRAEDIAAIHTHGLQVFAWTVNDAARMRTLRAWGVDGLISDDAALLMRTV